MQVGLQWYALGFPPVAKRVMWNPMPFEGAIDQRVQVVAAVLGAPVFHEVKDVKQSFKFTTTSHHSHKIGAGPIAFVRFVPVNPSGLPHLVRIDALRFSSRRLDTFAKGREGRVTDAAALVRADFVRYFVDRHPCKFSTTRNVRNARRALVMMIEPW